MSMTDRVRKLRQQSLDSKETLSSERAELLTDFYQAYSTRNVSVPVQRALAFRYLMEHKTVIINEGELIVGEKGPAPKVAPKAIVQNNAFVAPVEVPQEIKPEEGLDLGVEGGVVGRSGIRVEKINEVFRCAHVGELDASFQEFKVVVGPEAEPIGFGSGEDLSNIDQLNPDGVGVRPGNNPVNAVVGDAARDLDIATRREAVVGDRRGVGSLVDTLEHRSHPFDRAGAQP